MIAAVRDFGDNNNILLFQQFEASIIVLLRISKIIQYILKKDNSDTEIRMHIQIQYIDGRNVWQAKNQANHPSVIRQS